MASTAICSPRLLVAISGHGYGHAAQVAPVINALRRRIPRLELALYSRVPRELLDSRFDGPFHLVEEAPDVGLLMDSAIDVRVEATARAYSAFHEAWKQRFDHDVEIVKNIRPTLVIADVPYLVIAAAASLGIPALAMCSLNWADVFESYCAEYPGSKTIAEQIRAAYQQSELFIRPEPAMEVDWFERTQAIGPIARPAQLRRDELRAELGARSDQLVVLLALGGIPSSTLTERWPDHHNVLWLVPSETSAPGAISVNDLDVAKEMSFVDLQASCDCLLTKPGYNTFVEAACHSVPVVYVRRGDWPEEPVLIPWLRAHGRCREISRQQLERGDFLDILRELTFREHPEPIEPTGADEAAELFLKYL